MRVLASAERSSINGVRAIVDAGQLSAFGPALVADDDEPQLRGFPHVPGGTTVGPGVVAHR